MRPAGRADSCRPSPPPPSLLHPAPQAPLNKPWIKLFEAGFSEAHLSFTISLLQCLAMGGKQHKPSFCGFSEFSIENVPKWNERKCEGAAHSTLPPQDSDCIPPSQGPGCNPILGPGVYPVSRPGLHLPSGSRLHPLKARTPPAWDHQSTWLPHEPQLTHSRSHGFSGHPRVSQRPKRRPGTPFCPSNAASPSLSA